MEFYVFHRQAFGAYQSAFQFPTGWNSTRAALLWGDRISQFQFPTGWNSTPRPLLQRECAQRVSIPNGMEFYAKAPKRKHCWERFNSQRDGILPMSSMFKWRDLGVSIPNGMEFYLNGADYRYLAMEFQFPTGWNSTRLWTGFIDILRCVSIPNGMEFYGVILDKKIQYNIVSIPNGMEFYLHFWDYFPNPWCFNSQRDGILLLLLLHFRRHP